MQKVATKLVAVMEKCGYVQKDGDNKQQKYKYVSEAAVLGKIQPVLVEQKLIAIPKFTIISEREKPTANGAIWQLTTVQCEMNIIDSESGESLTIIALGTGVDPNDKGIAKAQTMAQKYAWLKALQIETGDDPEADGNVDNQTFVSSSSNQTNWEESNKKHVIDTKNDPFFEITRLWNFAGWNINELPEYISKRFAKPQEQINTTEYTTLLKELINYLQGQGKQFENIPF